MTTLTIVNKVGGTTFIKSKNSWRVDGSTNNGFQLVGMCTVPTSSTESSFEFPTKSKDRQALHNFKIDFNRVCY